jgi:hypothetical protein
VEHYFSSKFTIDKYHAKVLSDPISVALHTEPEKKRNQLERHIKLGQFS